MQEALVGLLFLAALGYLVWMAVRNFSLKDGCPGCGSCGGIDVKKIEKQFRKKEKDNRPSTYA